MVATDPIAIVEDVTVPRRDSAVSAWVSDLPVCAPDDSVSNLGVCSEADGVSLPWAAEARAVLSRA